MSEAARIEQPEELEEMEEQEEQEEQEVAVLDDASAEYLIRRIREAEEQYQRMEAWYNGQKEKAKAIRDRTVAWAERGLRGYFELVPKKKAKTQMSYELPGAKLILKQQEPEYDTDDEKLLPWLRKNRPELIKVKETPDWAKLKKELLLCEDGSMATQDGEIVPGVTATARPDKFNVTIK